MDEKNRNVYVDSRSCSQIQWSHRPSCKLMYIFICFGLYATIYYLTFFLPIQIHNDLETLKNVYEPCGCLLIMNENGLDFDLAVECRNASFKDSKKHYTTLPTITYNTITPCLVRTTTFPPLFIKEMFFSEPIVFQQTLLNTSNWTLITGFAGLCIGCVLSLALYFIPPFATLTVRYLNIIRCFHLFFGLLFFGVAMKDFTTV